MFYAKAGGCQSKKEMEDIPFPYERYKKIAQPPLQIFSQVWVAPPSISALENTPFPIPNILNNDFLPPQNNGKWKLF